MSTVISVEQVSKSYRLGQIGGATLKEDFGRWWAKMRGRPDPLLKIGEEHHARKQGDVFWALDNVSFQVKEGEVLGIIGRNGAGKSTLLKILSQVTTPTNGEIKVRGRIASLLEVGTGFHPELTGRENIFLNGAILGMTKAEIHRKFDEIVDFSGVEEFIDTPVKRYSSGMYVRLAFAVAAHLEPEILIVDEVLAVGDAQFQKKCLGKMQDVSQKQGRTVLFVSHNMAAIAFLCDRGVVLERGRVVFLGLQTEAIGHYQIGSTGPNTLENRSDRLGNGRVRIYDIKIQDIAGNPLEAATCGQDIQIALHYRSHECFSSDRLEISVQCFTRIGSPVFVFNNRMSGESLLDVRERGVFVCRIRKLPIVPSSYRLAYSVILGSEYLDAIDDAVDFNVVAGDFYNSGHIPSSTHGQCLVEGSWRHEPNPRFS